MGCFEVLDATRPYRAIISGATPAQRPREDIAACEAAVSRGEIVAAIATLEAEADRMEALIAARRRAGAPQRSVAIDQNRLAFLRARISAECRRLELASA